MRNYSVNSKKPIKEEKEHLPVVGKSQPSCTSTDLPELFGYMSLEGHYLRPCHCESWAVGQPSSVGEGASGHSRAQQSSEQILQLSGENLCCHSY
jgi:hypothetical protein